MFRVKWNILSKWTLQHGNQICEILTLGIINFVGVSETSYLLDIVCLVSLGVL
jgi:hypothetical protein